MRCRSKCVFDKQTRIESLTQKTQRYDNAHNRTENNGIFRTRLSRIIGYKLLIPSEIEFHNSSSLGLKMTMASMAITTNTPTSMAYSVVP